MLNRTFEASALNRKWIGEITNPWTTGGWLYVAAVSDLSSRCVVARYCITPIAAGNTPASHASGSWPIMAVCSTSRSANVWKQRRDGELFSSLKIERTARKLYRTRDEAKADLFDYLERFYNPKRRHSRIGYMSPMEFERPAGLA